MGTGTYSAAMHRADLVAEWIAQVGKADFACRPFAPARRILDAFAAVSDAGVVESLGLLGVGTREADGAAIGMRRRLAIDRLGDAEYARLRAIEDAALRIGFTRRDGHPPQHGSVELLGRGEIVGADHDV